MLEQLAYVQKQPFFGHALVDDVAQSLASSLRRKRSPRTPDVRQPSHDIVVDGANPQRRQGNGNLFLDAAVHCPHEQCLER